MKRKILEDTALFTFNYSLRKYKEIWDGQQKKKVKVDAVNMTDENTEENMEEKE